jgi:hypothetical protein
MRVLGGARRSSWNVMLGILNIGCARCRPRIHGTVGRLSCSCACYMQRLNDTIGSSYLSEKLAVRERRQILRGEDRRLYPWEVGAVVRLERYRIRLKRLSLAMEATVSEKTLERLENGEAVSDRTYRRVAAALGLPDSTFLTRHYGRVWSY